jgi:hypothetical protein
MAGVQIQQKGNGLGGFLGSLLSVAAPFVAGPAGLAMGIGGQLASGNPAGAAQVAAGGMGKPKPGGPQPAQQQPQNYAGGQAQAPNTFTNQFMQGGPQVPKMWQRRY